MTGEERKASSRVAVAFCINARARYTAIYFVCAGALLYVVSDPELSPGALFAHSLKYSHVACVHTQRRVVLHSRPSVCEALRAANPLWLQKRPASVYSVRSLVLFLFPSSLYPYFGSLRRMRMRK